MSDEIQALVDGLRLHYKEVVRDQPMSEYMLELAMGLGHLQAAMMLRDHPLLHRQKCAVDSNTVLHAVIHPGHYYGHYRCDHARGLKNVLIVVSVPTCEHCIAILEKEAQAALG